MTEPSHPLWKRIVQRIAFVIKEPGGPEKLELREVPRPTLWGGWGLIRNRAFGLNRSECRWDD